MYSSMLLPTDRLRKITMVKTQTCCSSSNALIVKLKTLFAFLHSDTPSQVSLLESISYKELNKATNGFRRIITCDPKGTTYEAKFGDGSVSTVKEVIGSHHQGDEAFYKEVRLLGRLRHRHIVALRGYSVGRRSFLVFESTAHGSLKEHLNDPLKSPLSWKTRLQIALGVATALEYLQFFCDPPVCHISISSSSIILDEKFTPKVGNIGHLSLDGYETKTPGSSTDRVDLIPQFGMLLLELITGQSSETGGTDIIECLRKSPFCMSVHNMIDPDIGSSYDTKELRKLLAVASVCVKAEKTSAYSISHIRWYLQKNLATIIS